VAALIEVGEDGSLTIPAEAVRALQLDARAKVEWRVEDGSIRLRPARAGDEDAWAYTAQHLAAVERGRADVEAGRIYAGLTEEFLLSLAEKAEGLRRDGKELERETLHGILEDALRTGQIKPVDAAT
jgi:antitoxin component of MazEF toxin-antitoxin module